MAFTERVRHPVTQSSSKGGQNSWRLAVALAALALVIIVILLTYSPDPATGPAATHTPTGTSVSTSPMVAHNTRPEIAPSATATTEPRRRSMLHKKTQIEFLFIKGGRFTMGSPKSEQGRQEGESQRRVEVSDFWLGKTEVTREEYARYLNDNPDAPEPRYWTDPRFSKAYQPMVGMSWEDAMAYVTWAGLRLPTEAEWEYAARAGTATAYFSGNTEADLDTVGWYDGNSADQLREVAQKPANAFGLYDMHGNAWEWCSDFFGPYKGDRVKDPLGPPRGTRRAVRGGSWDDPKHCARSAHRVGFVPTERFSQVGFRVALSPASNK